MKTQLDLAEIKKIKKNGIKVGSMFSGCGGSSLGYKLAGCDVLFANEFDKEAQEVYELNHPTTHLFKGDIRELTGAQILKTIGLKKGELDILDGSPPCFAKGTLIYTNNGPVPIEDVKNGDLVLTHTNTMHKVTSTMQRKAPNHMIISLQGSTDLIVTEEHPFYVREGYKGWKKTKYSEPKWKKAKDLRSHNGPYRQDYMAFAINKQSTIPEVADIDLSTKEIWYFIGRYIGDGWIRHRHEIGKKSRHTVYVCTGKHEKNSFEHHIKKIPYNYNCYESRTTYKFTISSKDFVHFLEQFGRGAENKHLNDVILDLPIYLLSAFLDGYLDADGHHNKNKNNYSCSTVSKKLLYGIQHCVHKVYRTPTAITVRKSRKDVIEGRVVQCRESYQLRFRKDINKHQSGFYENGYMWYRYKDKEFIEEPITVYNFSVDVDESYVVNNVICHNCAAFSSMGNRDKDWGKEKNYSGTKQVVDDLFFEFARILKELQPKSFVAENVKGLTSGSAKYLLGSNEPCLIKEKSIIQILQDCNYNVTYKVMNSMFFDVPQSRERLIIIGTRKDLNIKPSHPFRNRITVTTKDAINDLIENGTDFPNSPKKQMFVEKYFRPGTTLKMAAEIAKKNKLTGVMMYYTRRDRWKQPFQTILQSGDRAFHPIKDRSLSIDECKRLCTFPDDFILPHNPKQNWERLGRAVPPNLMMHVAKHVVKLLRGKRNAKRILIKRTNRS